MDVPCGADAAPAKRLMIPVSAFSLLREAAAGALSVLSQAIDHGVDPRECYRRLGAICDLLDLIDGRDADEPTAEVDATRDADTVAELAALMLPTLTTAVGDLDDGDPSRATAEADLSLMCRLLAEAGGTSTQAQAIRPADRTPRG
jgi:hypothetical protein